MKEITVEEINTYIDIIEDELYNKKKNKYDLSKIESFHVTNFDDGVTSFCLKIKGYNEMVVDFRPFSNKKGKLYLVDSNRYIFEYSMDMARETDGCLYNPESQTLVSHLKDIMKSMNKSIKRI